jgi:hypothetical protein
VLNLSAEASAALDERLRTEDIAWIATVTADGPVHQTAAYLAKYRAGIAGLGTSPEQMAAEYSTALRITPARVRVY